MNALGKALFAFVLVVGLVCIGGGVSLIVERETGTRAEATVGECVGRNSRFKGTHCTGTWVVGGSFVGGGGRLQVGTIEGAESSDVGKTIDVTVWGDRACVRSLARPIIFVGLGLLLAVLSGLALIGGLAPFSRTPPI
jgi:hypothetical protein